MSNPDQAEYEDVADAFKSLKVSSRAKVVASEDGKGKEKALPPIPPPPQRTPYQPRYPAHRQSSDDMLPISLRPNVPSSTIYPPPISMPTPHAAYLERDPLVTNPLPRPPALHPVLAGNVPPATPPRTSNPYAPPHRVSMPRPDVPPSDLSMPEAILNPSSPPSTVHWPPPMTPYRPTNDPYLNGFSTPQPPRPEPVSPPPKGTLDKPARPRAASVPPDNTAPDTQCSAITKAGKRCTRQVKSGPALAYQAPGVLLDRFCFQHTKDVLQPTGFYSHAKVNTWVTFAEWIPDYLQPDTQAALRAEMEKPASTSDKDGYIYAYEIRNPKTPSEVHIKVGRAINLVKRLDEWSKQCVSREVIIRGWWPGTIEDNNQDDSSNSVSLLKGKINPGEKGKYCHRLERLIHLELSDIALNSTHLASEFNKKTSAKKAKADTTSTSSKAPPASKLVKKPCPDCGAVHKEIFTLERVTSGKMKGREWEDVVQPIIEKWGKFVTEFV
ncbi:unnamed protein product [Rhizoctonia solani]|uniref:Bacteriophage T5 Orf172 DNA-binding domain-containing protein n=1 Tax=Rhizoctonia solani TaxID=456999 RepID=A0A8H3BLF9_9AGAM|nr:unnamed protein product [Rhizoctonia solani]